MMADLKWNMVVDVALCTNCNNCVVATQDEYMGNAFPGYSAPSAPGVKVMEIDRHVRGADAMVDVSYVPRMCQHCDDAPCVRQGDEAVVKRADGIVIIDPAKARGRRDLVNACPHGAVVWNDVENVPQIWTFDAHLLDQGWSAPRCVQACPSGAMAVHKVTDADMAARVEKEGLTVWDPQAGTKPRVYYRHLDRVTTHFIGVQIHAGEGDGEINVSGAEVELTLDGRRVMAARSDAFGEVRFDGLADASSGYAVRISHPDYPADTCVVEGALTESRVVTVKLGR